jgi:cell envelope opacity-associated protein A
MSLISKDFRLNQQQPQTHGHSRLRWALLAIAGAGIGAVIASTNTATDNTEQIAADSLPSFQPVTKSTEQLARESFSLSLPELQARQEILDDANNLTPKQWREYKVKSGDNLARLFKRAKIKPQQLDELMKSGEEVKTLTKIFPKDIIRVLSDENGKLQALRYDIDHKSYLMVDAGSTLRHRPQILPHGRTRARCAGR